jgi:hypothetical protein
LLPVGRYYNCENKISAVHLIVPQGRDENVSRSEKTPALISIQCNLTVHKTVKFNPGLRDLLNFTQQNVVWDMGASEN